MTSPENGAAEFRAWLAGVLGGEVMPLPGGDYARLVSEAEVQGVTALVFRMLDAERHGALRQALANSAKRLAAVSLYREFECRRVLEVLHSGGLTPLLLKGSSLSHWLYPESYLRETADFDLLFRSAAQAKEATLILQQQGYVGGSYFGRQAHEVTLRGQVTATLSVDVDLHWRLFNLPGFSDVLPVEQLFAHAMHVPRFHDQAFGLCAAHAIVHACLHRAMNLHMGVGDRLKWLYDLHLLAGRLTSQDWSIVTEICQSRGMSGVCLHGFHASQREFGTRFPEGVLADLQRLSQKERLNPDRLADWRYMQGYALTSIPTISGRLRWVLAKLFPAIGYLRSFYGARLSWQELFLERTRRLFRRVR